MPWQTDSAETPGRPVPDGLSARATADRYFPEFPRWVGYSIAIASEALLTLLLWLLTERFPATAFRAPFVASMLPIAYYFGLGPVILAAIVASTGYLMLIRFGGPGLPFYGQLPSLIVFIASLAAASAATLLFRRESIRIRHLSRQLDNERMRYERLFRSMNEGFALHEIILDESGKPVDYRSLEVNPSPSQPIPPPSIEITR